MISRNYMTEMCDRLPFVDWDRCVLMPEQSHAVVYGWVGRSAKRDFVVLQFWFDDPDEPMVSFLTSSVRYSPKINEIIMPEGTPHNDCQTVQRKLPKLQRKVNR